jgi:ubiquinone/menaquinone biosynthesis C-methylase UbiE
MKEKLKNIFFRIWYWYVSTVDKNAEVIFMNFGYSKDNHKIKLDKNDEKNRCSVQLYNLVASGANINGKDILEVGCGRGGGLSYIKRYLFPNSVTGIDLNKKAIQFCKNHYPEKSNVFLKANAQNLPLLDVSFDVVINVESSHRYPQPELFFNEVYRVLRPGGFFLFADFRQRDELLMLDNQIKKTQFKLINKENITSNVVEALKLATHEREVLIKKLLPVFLQNLGKNFAATEGSPTYNRFANGHFEYIYYILEK